MFIAGIDVGVKGALVAFNGSTLSYIDFKDSYLLGYINFLKKHKVDLVVVEKVHSMPNQGVKAMFSFGQRLGELEGMLQTLEIPYELVGPKAWQKVLGISPKSTKQDIANTILKLYPKANLYGVKGGLLDGRSDALGLMHYGRIKYNQGD